MVVPVAGHFAPGQDLKSVPNGRCTKGRPALEGAITKREFFPKRLPESAHRSRSSTLRQKIDLELAFDRPLTDQIELPEGHQARRKSSLTRSHSLISPSVHLTKEFGADLPLEYRPTPSSQAFRIDRRSRPTAVTDVAIDIGGEDLDVVFRPPPAMTREDRHRRHRIGLMAAWNSRPTRCRTPRRPLRAAANNFGSRSVRLHVARNDACSRKEARDVGGQRGQQSADVPRSPLRARQDQAGNSRLNESHVRARAAA